MALSEKSEDANSKEEHPDLAEALLLLKKINSDVQHVTTLIDQMLHTVQSGEKKTDEGISFLEMKNNMLLSYLINLLFVVLKKSSGKSIEGDPCIERLVEIMTVLEKVKPIDRKIKYQVDKLVKSAASSSNADDPSAYKANPEEMEDEDIDEDEEAENQAGNKRTENNNSKIYVPPKLSAVHYMDGQMKPKEKMKKQALSSAIMEELREEYLDSPAEINQGVSKSQQKISKEELERQQYEEEYLTRLPQPKKSKSRSNKFTTMGNLANEIVDFGSSSTGTSKRKRKVGKQPKFSKKRKVFKK